MKPVQKKQLKSRINVVALVFAALFAVIGARAGYLQIYRASWLLGEAEQQYEKSVTAYGKRGSIFDARHREMAVTIDGTSIGAYPGKIGHASEAAAVLSKTLQIGRKSLERELSSKRAFVWVKRQATPKEAAKVAELNLEGVEFVSEHSRFYPNTMLAAQILGFSGIDGHGLEGIEFSYDSYLKGDAGKIPVLADAFGHIFNTENRNQDVGGSNLILTIDRTVQFIVESALKDAVDEFSAKSGMAIVMVPQTGAVLALANYPFFNPNAFGKFEKQTWRNRAITDPFEPGSTMKIFSAAAALEGGQCASGTIFFCENGAYRIGTNVVHDTHAYGWLSLQQIVKYSSNIGAMKVAEKIGPEALYDNLLKFGFGAKTGIDCPGETSGSLIPLNRWSRIDAGAIAFGQGVSVSAIQLITAACAIANDGVRMKPYIVQAITDPNGALTKSFSPQETRRVISPATARTVREIMKTVVDTEGTGRQAILEGYSACGKTGTAQKVDETGTYAKGKYVASFLGLVPAEVPRLAILVVIDEPRGQHYGGVVAGPVFKRIAQKTLGYMNIPPETAADRLTALLGNEVNG